MSTTLDMARRIERALRQTLHEEETLDEDGMPSSATEPYRDRDFINKLYSSLKPGHSFSFCDRVARLAFICKVLGVEFDINAEIDRGY